MVDIPYHPHTETNYDPQRIYVVHMGVSKAWQSLNYQFSAHIRRSCFPKNCQMPYWDDNRNGVFLNF